MLSIQQCKKYLNDCRYTEQEIEDIRDTLYQPAQLLVDRYIEKKQTKETGQKRHG